MNEQDAPSFPTQTKGWFAAVRSDDALELLQANPLALVLAYIIATRAKWRNGFNRHDLKIGEAFIGDYQNYGMSERNYRTAKEQLSKWHFAAFKPTNKGCVAKLTDTRLFRVIPNAGDGQNASGRRTADDPADSQPTTNLELKNKEQKNGRAYSTTKASKLSRPQWEIANRFEAVLDGEWVNDAGKWINRIKGFTDSEGKVHKPQPDKCERVVAEVESAAKEERIKTSAARYAEETWKRFK